MPYVHLANGDVRKVSEKDLALNYENIGNTTHFRDNGKEHQIIGVYPEEVDYEVSEDEKASAAEDEQYQEWKRSRDNESENAE